MTTRERIIIAFIAFALAVAGFFLWLQGHDARIQMEATIISNAPAIKAAQQQVMDLTKQIQSVNDRAVADKAAVDAKFDKLTTLTQQIAVLAQVTGMKQTPVVVTPGQVPQLPQGGAVVTPQQAQDLTAYAHACEDCKVENQRLTDTLDRTQGIVAAKSVENDKLKADLQAAQRAAKMGFRYKLMECAKRSGIGATAGAVGAAMSTSNPLQSKPVGRAAAVGATIGGVSCLLF